MQMRCERLLQSLQRKRVVEIISSEHKKSKKVFLSLSNFPSAVQEEKKSLQDTETEKSLPMDNPVGKRDVLIRGEPKYGDAKACEGFK